MALEAIQQNVVVDASRRPGSGSARRMRERGGMLGACVALTATLIGVCALGGPGPLVWSVVAAIWSTLAVVCVRIQLRAQGSSSRD